MTDTRERDSRMWRAEVERILAWRSDDFGHDCTALLEAESAALQRIGEDWLRLDVEVERLKRIIAKELTENDELGREYTYVNALIDENKRLRDEVEHWKKQHVMSRDAANKLIERLRRALERIEAKLLSGLSMDYAVMESDMEKCAAIAREALDEGNEK